MRERRGRLVLLVVVALALPVISALVSVRALLHEQVRVEVEDDLRASMSRLTALAAAITVPEGADQVRAILQAQLRTAATADVQLALLDGQAVVPAAAPRIDLTTETALLADLRAVTSTRRGSLDTAAGAVEYIAVPLRQPGQTEVRGVLLTGELPAERLDRVRGALLRVGLGLGVVAALAGWLLVAALPSLTRTGSQPGGSAARSPAAAPVPALPGSDHRQLLADAAFELRTPLVMARGQLDLDADGQSSPALWELDRIGEVVDAMLLLASAPSEDFLRPSTVDAGALLAGVRDRADAADGARQWTVRARNVPEFSGDPARLGQALDALVRSAARHTGTGARSVLVAVRAGDDVRLEVHGGAARPDDLDRSVADAVARAHGGRLDLGGARSAPVALVVPAGGPAGSATSAASRRVDLQLGDA